MDGKRVVGEGVASVNLFSFLCVCARVLKGLGIGVQLSPRRSCQNHVRRTDGVA